MAHTDLCRGGHKMIKGWGSAPPQGTPAAQQQSAYSCKYTYLSSTFSITVAKKIQRSSQITLLWGRGTARGGI